MVFSLSMPKSQKQEKVNFSYYFVAFRYVHSITREKRSSRVCETSVNLTCDMETTIRFSEICKLFQWNLVYFETGVHDKYLNIIEKRNNNDPMLMIWSAWKQPIKRTAEMKMNWKTWINWQFKEIMFSFWFFITFQY